MATYEELHELKSNGALLDRVETACVIAAHGIVGGAATNQPARAKWAAQVFASPRLMAVKVLPAVLAANKSATVATIQAATDTQLQTNVDAMVDLFADLIA